MEKCYDFTTMQSEIRPLRKKITLCVGPILSSLALTTKFLNLEQVSHFYVRLAHHVSNIFERCVFYATANDSCC